MPNPENQLEKAQIYDIPISTTPPVPASETINKSDPEEFGQILETIIN